MSEETKNILVAIPAAATVMLGLTYLFIGIYSSPGWMIFLFFLGVFYTAVMWEKINQND